ncbi:unnamed protein product [Brassicogethes aeneus]|uniref:UDP-glucuronosyltransferase n=1 Tax=Brassicogethes aeneus TaxID=1431903 RepID=A0A9P0FNY0_BRAAE|nr:unnamed protein product [Brassicogethes aeneus]
MKAHLLANLFVLFLVCKNVDNSKILGVFPMASHSHYTLGFTLMKELVERGHEVTFITSYRPKEDIKNLKIVSVEEIVEGLTDHKKSLYQQHDWSYHRQTKLAFKMGIYVTRKIFKVKSVVELIRSHVKFDIIIIENFMNEALIGLGHHFKAPVILLAPGPTTYLCNFFVGNPTPSAYIPNIASRFSSDMTLIERIKNVYYDILGEYLIHQYVIPKHNEIMQEHLPGTPNLSEIMSNVSLILTSSHVSINTPAPTVPAVKEIGGYHVGKPEQLPSDLQEFLDNAKEGVVLFSLGSNLKSSDLPDHMKNAILKTFSIIKQKVLLKFEEDIPNKPENVKIMNWLPQSSVLAHSNTKLFISHGGLLSVIESVHYGVPILGIPVFWDQECNIKSAENNGFAINLPLKELNEETFFTAVNELLNNPEYTRNVKSRQRILHDQPFTPMDTAVYWIEYVIRHKGAHHFKSPSLKLKWYQINMLDIAIILTLVTIVLFIVLYFIIKHIISMFGGKHTAIRAKKNQ